MSNAKNQSKTHFPIPEFINRQLMAKWYGIETDALRYRMNKAGISISNRLFTESDISQILTKLGMPLHLPAELHDWALSLIAT